MENPPAIQRTVHKVCHQHRIWYSERILIFPYETIFLKVINNIPKINEVYVTHQACSLSLKKGIDAEE